MYQLYQVDSIKDIEPNKEFMMEDYKGSFVKFTKKLKYFQFLSLVLGYIKIEKYDYDEKTPRSELKGIYQAFETNSEDLLSFVYNYAKNVDDLKKGDVLILPYSGFQTVVEDSIYIGEPKSNTLVTTDKGTSKFPSGNYVLVRNPNHYSLKNKVKGKKKK
jgi:hypothetical protein